jgi:hypothetical protein
MSQRLFTAELGYSVDELVDIVATNGAPSDNRPKGSLSLDYANGKLYVKTTDGSGADKWADPTSASSTEEGYLRSFIGKAAAGSETPDYGAAVEYASQTASLESAITSLDAGIVLARHKSVNATVTTSVALDSVKVDDYDLVRWIVHAKDGAGAVKVEEIIATHDGISSADATNVDYSVYGKLRIGNIPGFAVSVSLSGTTTAQVMRLMVASTDAVAFKAIRSVV